MQHVLNSLGWTWMQNGILVKVVLDGRAFSVFVPIGRVQVTFDRELAREGYHEAPSVGAPSVGSIFGKVGRAFKKVGRAATRAVSRAGHSIGRVASKAAGAAVAIGRNKLFRGALAASSFVVPALAPAAIALETANRAYDAGQQGMRYAHMARNVVQHPRQAVQQFAHPMHFASPLNRMAAQRAAVAQNALARLFR